jgi:succinate dehydrogenase flavin-adding protein (antitoxin of CptAB toxin-antitoxin module)
MISPTAELVASIAERIAALLLALEEDLAASGQQPATYADFESRNVSQRVGSRALLKTVEQLEDQQARMFRTLLQMLDVDISGWFAQDIANQMEKLEVVADAAQWMSVVKLRNRLVHDYPIDQEARFLKLVEAYDAVDILRDCARRTQAFIKQRNII